MAVGTTTSTESYLYPADNAPTFDFTLLARTVTPVKTRVTSPVTSTPGSKQGGGSLAATGLETGLPWLGTLVLASLLVLRRRTGRRREA